MTLTILVMGITAALGLFLLGLSVVVLTPPGAAPVAVARSRAMKTARAMGYTGQVAHASAPPLPLNPRLSRQSTPPMSVSPALTEE